MFVGIFDHIIAKVVIHVFTFFLELFEERFSGERVSAKAYQGHIPVFF
jgi:hypothetical protein